MPIELPKTWDLKKEEVPGIVWIEGVEPSDTKGDVTFILRYENDQGAMVEDEVNVSVLEVDLDIDSDNNNGLQWTGRLGRGGCDRGRRERPVEAGKVRGRQRR